MPLSAKQEQFIVEYLKCRNAAEAARRAGYSEKTARVIGAQNLSKLNIAEEIERRTKDKLMDLDEALSRLADFARADLGQWLTDDGYIDIAAMKRDGATHIIRKVKRTERSGVSPQGAEWSVVTAEIETYSAADANKFIAELHNAGPTGTAKDPFHIKHIREVRSGDDSNSE